jgi:hypothetical protein
LDGDVADTPAALFQQVPLMTLLWQIVP